MLTTEKKMLCLHLFIISIFQFMISTHQRMLLRCIRVQRHYWTWRDCTRQPSNFTREFDVSNPNLDELAMHGFRWKTIDPKLNRLHQLNSLNLDDICLEILDPNCFRNLSQLNCISLVHNKLTEIPNHIFDSNDLLRYVDFSHNNIRSIGLHVFSNASILKHLEYIILHNNQLTTLEPWPIIRMNVRRTEVDLNSNFIWYFTNELNWIYNCDMGAVNGTLHLKNNWIRRLSAIQHGWNIEFNDILCIWKTTLITTAWNPIHCDCMEYYWIKYYHIHRPHFGTLMSGPQADFPASVPLDILNCIQPCFEGQCTCTEMPEKRMYHVKCHNQSHLPNELPKPYWNVSYKFMLDYSNNQITDLLETEYLVNVDIIDVSNNQIRFVDPVAIRRLQTATEIKLHGNRLRMIYPDVIFIKHFTGKISLHNNPWICSCQNTVFQVMMEKLNKSLSSPSAIRCASPQWLNGSNLLDADFCENERFAMMFYHTTVSAFTMVRSLAVITIALVLSIKHFINRPNRRVLNEMKWDDSYEGDCDAFIAFAWEDYDKVKEITESLEEEHGFKCCIHNRDFHPGKRFMNEMGKNIDASRRVLCFLSPNFLRSTFCVWELEYAFEGDVQRRKRRLAAIVLELVIEFDESNQGVQRYISKFTYLKFNDPEFTTKLLRIMPSKPLQPKNRVDDEP